jgi:hypothetical protein
MLRLDEQWPTADEVPWCSAFANYIAWLLRLPRSKSLTARSWLTVGMPIALESARAAFDIIVLKRGPGHQPGPEVLDAPGHVGFFAGLERTRPTINGAPFDMSDRVESRRVLVLAGNQGNSVSIAPFPVDGVIGARRLFVDSEE